MLVITENNNAVEFNIAARPKASRNAIDGVHDGALKVFITAPPDKGKANAAVIKLLAKELNIPQSSIEIIHGTSSRHKRVRIIGVTPAQVHAISGGDGK